MQRKVRATTPVPAGAVSMAPMIECHLRELIAAKSRRERRRITYEVISSETGVNKNTLTRLANDRAGRVGLSVMDRLCAYFECQPCDLFVHVSEG